MANEITQISPEGLEIANMYLMYGNIAAVSQQLQISEYEVTQYLGRREVKKYIDTAYLDAGYRNRSNIASVMDEIIASKLEEAQESEVYTKKDLPDLMMMAHKMRMDELKALESLEKVTIKNQLNMQINDGAGGFAAAGGANYSKLMDAILNPDED